MDETELMNLCYTAASTANSPHLPWSTFAPLYRSGTTGIQQQQQQLSECINSLGQLGQLGNIGSIPATPIAPAKKESNTVAKLIRFTVVDPEPILAQKAPERCILLSGTRMLSGADERGFLMDLAPEVATRLGDHNAFRETVTYEDSGGRTRQLKATKLGALDVVVEVIKDYKN